MNQGWRVLRKNISNLKKPPSGVEMGALVIGKQSSHRLLNVNNTGSTHSIVSKHEVDYNLNSYKKFQDTMKSRKLQPDSKKDVFQKSQTKLHLGRQSNLKLHSMDEVIPTSSRQNMQNKRDSKSSRKSLYIRK